MSCTEAMAILLIVPRSDPAPAIERTDARPLLLSSAPTPPSTRAGELLLKGVRGLVHELVRLELDAQLHALLIDEGAIGLERLLARGPAFAGATVIDIPALARLRLEDQSAVVAALNVRLPSPVTDELRAAILAGRLVQAPAKDLGVRRELEVLEAALLGPGSRSISGWTAEDDDADSPMLGSSDEEVGLERVDLAVRDDDEERQVAREGVLRSLGGVREDWLELGQLDEHAEERAGHCLRRQNQHFTPARA